MISTSFFRWSRSAWSSIIDATSFAFTLRINPSFDYAWSSASDETWTEAEASMSPRLWTETSMSISLSLILSRDDGIGVMSLDLVIVISILFESFLQPRLSFVLFLCLLLSPRAIFFGLQLIFVSSSGASWVCLLVFPCPGGGVDTDWQKNVTRREWEGGTQMFRGHS